MEQYRVTGMSCAACVNRVEKAVSKVDGVTECSVSLLTNSMVVKGSASPGDIIAAVEKAGYQAEEKNLQKDKDIQTQDRADYVQREDTLADKESPVILKRLVMSAILLLPLMYVSMGHVMWDFPVGKTFSGNSVALGVFELLFTVAIMVINQKFFVSGVRSLMHGAPNMDTLVALGSFASFAYSVVILFLMTIRQNEGDAMGAMHLLHELYFESAAMILTLITLGKYLEALAKGRTTDALKGLMSLAPQTAVVLKEGKEITIPTSQVKKADIFVVRPGESIPVDGIVLEGSSAVNEAALTGESIPVDKEAGETVYAATINQSGFLKCEATKVGEDTTLSKIIQMVSDAAATKAPIAKIADKVSGVFVPTVMILALLAFLVWLFVGEDFGFALARGITVLVISCPCALGLATPVAIMVGNGVAAKNGILFKNAVALEETGKAEIVVLDKTGTITKGELWVTDLVPAEGESNEELLETAYLLEKKSEHPLGKAIVRYVEEKWENMHPEMVLGWNKKEITAFESSVGKGLTACDGADIIIGGKLAFLKERIIIPEVVIKKAEAYAKVGKTPLYFAKNDCFLGMVVVCDRMKEDCPQAIRQLKKMGKRVVMLTGDNEQTAKAIGEKAGVDEVIAGVLPDGKEEVIRSLKEKGKVIMVGDGINDAPALTRADIGIAVGAGTDIAIDAADVILMRDTLMEVVYAIRLSGKTRKNICENLFWAFIYNVIGIPLAAGVWIPLTGWELNPMFGAAAMSLSSFCVVMNALRLNLYKPDRYDQTEEACLEDKTESNQRKTEEKKMTKTMKINGMMCEHCEARVKKCLEALEGVNGAQVSHEKNEAVVTLERELDDAILKKAVEEQDYEVVSIE